MKQKPYSKRSDLEKIVSNWVKTIGLFRRSEWSNSIVRVTTAVELAANFVIRKELIEGRKLETEIVNQLLLNANGLRGKVDKLIKPILKTSKASNLQISRGVANKINEINDQRNSIAHSGAFKIESTAKSVIEKAHEVIILFVESYGEKIAERMPLPWSNKSDCLSSNELTGE